MAASKIAELIGTAPSSLSFHLMACSIRLYAGVFGISPNVLKDY